LAAFGDASGQPGTMQIHFCKSALLMLKFEVAGVEKQVQLTRRLTGLRGLR